MTIGPSKTTIQIIKERADGHCECNQLHDHQPGSCERKPRNWVHIRDSSLPDALLWVCPTCRTQILREQGR